MTDKNDKKTFYITTPLYYSSGKLHLGHCYTSVVCDSIARFYRKDGYDVFFLTGTDEHGQNIAKRAEEKGLTPKQFVDNLYHDITDLWKLMKITYDKFIRTTDQYHEKAVQKIFEKLYKKGDIYKAEYEGWYCAPCESFWTESQLEDGKCPDCHRDVTRAKEESYFFRLSKYADKLLQLYESNPEFLQPKSRVNEMVNNFIKPGLQDLAVSRTSVSWGVPVPFDDRHSIYVWIDALANYITALGYESDDTALFEKYWPADVHMMAKEIVRFHSIIWPSLLMALDLPVPKHVYGHGWLLFGGDKMSKSKGNVVDPYFLVGRYGLDAIRYYLLREVPFGNDGVFTIRSLLNRYNDDLCNSLGNLVSRTIAMIEKNFDAKIPSKGKNADGIDRELATLAEETLQKVKQAVQGFNIPQAMSEIMALVYRANKYIDETTPWVLAKDPDQKDRLGEVLYNLAEVLRFVAILLSPFLPDTAQSIFDKLGQGNIPDNFDGVEKFGQLAQGSAVEKGKNLFERINVEEELKKLDELFAE